MKVSCLIGLLMVVMVVASSQQVRACPVSRAPGGQHVGRADRLWHAQARTLAVSPMHSAGSSIFSELVGDSMPLAARLRL